MTATAGLALVVFIATFTVATLRGVHLGLLMLVAAAIVGPTVAGMTMREVIGGFPVSILVLVAGVSFFFGTATLNGTIQRVLAVMLARTRGLQSVVPAVFFGLAAVMAAMGSPQAGLATGPVGMSAVRQARVDPVLMAIALNGGISAGSFAPTSLFGVITHQVAQQAGIDVNVFVLLAVAIVANVVSVAVAALLFRTAPPDDASSTVPAGGPTASVPSAAVHAVAARTSLAPSTDSTPFGLHQWATVACLVVLAVGVGSAAAAGVDLDIGILLLGLGAVLALLDPATGARAFARIDWSTAFIVGGIVTYVGVLQKLEAVTQLGREAMAVGSPLVAALLVCTIAALVSAVASTTAVLAALVPMAVPLATSGALPGWALITALGVSATIVDGSPFSNTGATLIAAAADADRPRLRTMLLRWSMAMVVAGPLVVLPALLALARWGN